MVKEIQIDVESKHLVLIKKILKRHIAYKTVWAYGSRVNWTANQYSDLDLVVFEVNTVKLGELKESFLESDLPFTVDIMSWQKIPEKFKNKILKKYVVLQKKPELEGWKECKVGFISTYVNRGITPKYSDDGIPIINQKCIRKGVISKKYIKYHDLQRKYTSEKKLKSHDILINSTGVGTAGRVAIFNLEKEHLVDSHVSIVRIDEIKADALFVYHNFRDREDEFESYAEGSTGQVELGREKIKDIDILLPPLITEQKAIASILSSLDDKIDLLHRQNKTIEAMAETLFMQWFVEEAQEDWEVECLRNIADINPTYQLKKGEISTYVEMKNVSTSSFNPEGWYKRDFTSGMKFRNGDTLLARITPCLENGKTCFVTFLDEEEIGWGSTEYIVIRMKKQFHPYISYIIAKDKNFRDFAISSMSGSSGRQRAQAGVIKEYDLTVPPLEIIEELNRQLDRILSKLKNNANQICTIEKLRDTLLPRLMSGEVRVEYGN